MGYLIVCHGDECATDVSLIRGGGRVERFRVGRCQEFGEFPLINWALRGKLGSEYATWNPTYFFETESVNNTRFDSDFESDEDPDWINKWWESVSQEREKLTYFDDWAKYRGSEIEKRDRKRILVAMRDHRLDEFDVLNKLYGVRLEGGPILLNFFKKLTDEETFDFISARLKHPTEIYTDLERSNKNVWKFYSESETIEEGLQRIINNLQTIDVWSDYGCGSYEAMINSGYFDYMS